MWSRIKRHGLVHLLIVAIFVLPTLGLLHVSPNKEQPYASRLRLWFDGFEDQTIDTRMYYGRKPKVDPRIVLLAIDDASIKIDSVDDVTLQASPALAEMQKSGYPYPRDVYAAICDRLFAAGAKVVAFDILFQKPTASDSALARALADYRGKVVLAQRFSEDSTSIDLPAPSLVPSQDPLDEQLGYINFWPDYDSIVRNATYRSNLEEMSAIAGADTQPKLLSFAARIVQDFGRPELVPGDFTPRPLRFARGGSRGKDYVSPFPIFSVYEIFDSHRWDDALFRSGDYFRDKIVVVGPTAALFHDIDRTPAGQTSGVEIHLNAINALLTNELLTPTSDGFALGTVFFFAACALLLATLLPSIGARFGVALGIVAAYAGVVMAAYNGPGWLLPVVAPVGVFGASVGVGFVYDFVVVQIERYRLRVMFEGYSSKNVVKYLLSHPDSYKQMLAGTRRDISVLFSDIRGFTTIVETSPDSRELVRKLNEYLTAMVDCVIRQDGNLEKFMGDGIMAVWGNTPYTNGAKDDAIRATRAAIDMTVRLKQLNAKWLAEGRTEWKIGIGVNHGNVIVGDMGSTDHKEFAMVGDAVNLGSRLEGLTKGYHVQIMLGEKVAALVEDAFYLRSVAVVVVKGKSEPVKTFTVLGEKKEALPPPKLEFLRLHEEGIAAFRGREFERARKLFEQALELEPDDYIAQTYLKSSAHFAAHPPGADWNGVEIMTEK